MGSLDGCDFTTIGVADTPGKGGMGLGVNSHTTSEHSFIVSEGVGRVWGGGGGVINEHLQSNKENIFTNILVYCAYLVFMMSVCCGVGIIVKVLA